MSLHSYRPQTMWPEPDDRLSRPALEHAHRIRVVATDTHDPVLRAVMLDMADELESIWEERPCEPDPREGNENAKPC